MRRLARYAVRFLLGLLLLAAAGLAWAHWAIRQERAPLPDAAAIAAAARAGGDLPIRLAMVNTASQAMPRSTVLDAGADPHPHEAYVMSHPAFVLEWADGRLLLVDAGMTPAQAQDFGVALEWLGGAQAMVAHGAVADGLGAAAARAGGIVFTHLHSDHVGGLAGLCDAAPQRPLAVFMTDAQAQRPNYTTRGGLQAVADAPCARPSAPGPGPLAALPGFPGVYVIAAAGHTPGSQIVLAFVQDGAAVRPYAFTGDIVNALDGALADVPKPLLYRTLVVPEDGDRQAELRAFLRRLRDDAGFTLLVSHDQRALERAGVPAFRRSDQDER